MITPASDAQKKQNGEHDGKEEPHDNFSFFD